MLESGPPRAAFDQENGESTQTGVAQREATCDCTLKAAFGSIPRFGVETVLVVRVPRTDLPVLSKTQTG